MVRPFCVIGFSMLFTLFVLGTDASAKAVGAVLCAALIAFALSLAFRASRRDRTLPTAFAAVALSALLLFAAAARQAKTAAFFDGREMQVRGVLAELPFREDGRYYYVLRLDTANGTRCSEQLRLVTNAPLDLTPADRITCTAETFLLGGGSDEVLEYYRTEGLTVGAYPVGAVTIEPSVRTDLSGRILQLRERLTNALLSALPGDNGALLAAIAFGSDDALPDRVNNAFRAVGVSHILVVSGLHLTVWTMLLFAVFRQLGLRRRLSAAVGIGFVCFFTVLTGGAPSILRAAVMLCMVYAAEFFKRESDAFNAIGLALTGMLAVNPYAARSLSLLLSVFATLGILLCAEPLTKALSRPFSRVSFPAARRLLSALASAVAVTASAGVFTLPVQLWAVGSLSLATLPANLLMLTAGNAAMVLGSLGGALAQVGVLDAPVLFLAGQTARYMIAGAEALCGLPGVLMPIGSDFSKLLLALAFFGAAAVLLLRRPNKRAVQVCAGLLCGVFLLGNIGMSLHTRGVLRLAVASVGDGAGIVLSCRGETVVLGCGGDYFADSEIYAILSKYGATGIDALVLPGGGTHVSSGAVPLGERLPVRTLYYAPELDAETLPVGEEKVPVTRSVLRFADDTLTVAVQAAGAYRYAEIVYGGFRAIVSFTPENDFRGDAAALLICAGEMPKNTDAADFSLTVLSTADSADADFPALRSGTVCTTAENGSISVLVYPDGAFEYERM